MPKQIVLIPESVMGGSLPYLPSAMIEDLLAVAGLTTEQLDRLGAALEQEAGIPTDAKLEVIVSGVLGETPLSETVLRTLVNLRPERIEDTIRTLRQWSTASSANAAKLPAQRLDAIQDRLTRLIRNYPALVRYRKAQRLRTLTGRQAESLEVVCDLRPVFDQTREVVEGLIPLTILRIAYQGNEGTEVLEILLSGENLENLATEVERAQKKIRALQETVTRWVPNGWVDPD